MSLLSKQFRIFLFYALSKLFVYYSLKVLANLFRLSDLQFNVYTQQIPSNINSKRLNTLFEYVINLLEEKNGFGLLSITFSFQQY